MQKSGVNLIACQMVMMIPHCVIGSGHSGTQSQTIIMVAKLTLVFVSLSIQVVKPFGPVAGPYVLDVTKFENCEDQGTKEVVFGSKITKAGKDKYVYNEKFYLGHPVDKDFKMYVEVQKWGNGGWRPKTIEHTLQKCEDQWKVIGDFWKSLMKSAGKTVEKCPIPAGNYTANNWVIEFNMEKAAPVMEYGKYRAVMRFFYKAKLAGCFMLYCDIKPKAAFG